jgi:hypothetical protein
MAKTIHDLEVEFAEWRAQQRHLVETVDTMHSEMKEVRKAVFQAKWMLIGGLAIAGVMNSDLFMSLVLNFAGK